MVIRAIAVVLMDNSNCKEALRFNNNNTRWVEPVQSQAIQQSMEHKTHAPTCSRQRPSSVGNSSISLKVAGQYQDRQI